MTAVSAAGDKPALLSVRGLSVNFTHNDTVVHAVRGINFDIAPAETLALVGESGSGKSVTALSIIRLLDDQAAGRPDGQILFDGFDLAGATPRQLRGVRGNQIALVPQEPMSALNALHTIERQIAEPLMVHQGLSSRQARLRVIELLERVGIQAPEDRLSDYPHQLSGGQRQRVMIAMALANNPRLLIADEPTTALDVTIQAQILELLKKLQREAGMAILFITHDLGIVKRVADRVCVMQDGRIVESGQVETIMRRPTHSYTRQLLAATPSSRVPADNSSVKILVEIRNLKVWFPVKRGMFRRVVGHLKAVDDVGFDLRAGRTLGVVGESGSGKTTLGLAVLRLVGSSGRIMFDGTALHGLNSAAMRPYRRDMQVVFQDPYGSLSPRLTVEEIVAEGLGVHFPLIAAAERLERVIGALQEVGLDPHIRNRYPHEFSGGQRQRIAIARTLVLQPRLLVLDEPTSALDRSVQVQIVELLRVLQASHGLTYIFISHDLRLVRALADDLLIMRDGKIVESGPANIVFDDPGHSYTRTLLAAADYGALTG